MKFYFCETVGDGTDDNPFRPIASDFCAKYSAIDARSNPSSVGYMLVQCDITEEKHQELLLETSTIHIDTKNLSMSSKVEEIADRTELKEQLTSMGVDISNLTSQNTIQDVFNVTADHLLGVQKQ